MRKIAVPDEGAESLFGNLDENLKHLEGLFTVRIRTSGQELIVEGDTADVARAERVLEQLTSLMRGGYRLARGDVKTAGQLVAQDESVELADYFLRGAPRTSGRRQVLPKSVNQRRYLDAIERNDIVFGIGPAGTGKTYLAMAQAVSFLLAKKVNRIILARPAVEAGEKLGFLPGDLQEKVNPYLRPLYDALYDMLDVERAERLIERGTVEVAPIAFMRGRTLNDAFVILDEAQNTTQEQMKMFLTRLGFGSKAVITGDITQIDLPMGRTSGLVEAVKVVGNIEGIEFIWFDEKDVVRHQLVQQIVKAYESVRWIPTVSACRRRASGALASAAKAAAKARRSRSRTAAAARSATAVWPDGSPRSFLLRGAVAVALVTDRHIQKLNDQYRGKAIPTDVLSFAMDATGDHRGSSRNPRTANREPRLLGDIVIATGTAKRQAREFRHSYGTELRVLALHGLLHLLGYDHDDPDDRGRMARAEARLRRKGGLHKGLISRNRPPYRRRRAMR